MSKYQYLNRYKKVNLSIIGKTRGLLGRKSRENSWIGQTIVPFAGDWRWSGGDSSLVRSNARQSIIVGLI